MKKAISFDENKYTTSVFAVHKYAKQADEAYQLYLSLGIGSVSLDEFFSIHDTDKHIREKLYKSESMAALREAPIYQGEVKTQITLPATSTKFRFAYEAVAPYNQRAGEYNVQDYLEIKDGHIALKSEIYPLLKELSTTYIKEEYTALYEKALALQAELEALQEEYPHLRLLPSGNQAELLQRSHTGEIKVNPTQLIQN